ncbi:MAG: glycoside hydrolase family 3 N-terminal domain-containing protein [Lachnospiraceae bacterium]|nr:glycoside hydrolase family 3 N-terminal domain-containing protein [Lachnospiraceae bacterium]MDD3794918.1 glycoside hydrolase family 3 N-terminal domain-containing protein [Lachnospiraceae bacterium]
MKKKRNMGAFSRSMTVVFSTLLVVLIVGNELANANGSLINSTLKCTTYKIIEDENSTSEVIEYPTTYTTSDEVKDYGFSVVEEAEGEGIVLLKNENNVLPLTKGGKVSCFLNGSVNLNYSTSGSSAADISGYSTLRDALEGDDVQLTVNPELWDFYSEGEGSEYTPKKKLNRDLGMQVYSANAAPWSTYSDVEASFADYSDAAIVVISRSSGEGMDISTAESDGTDGSYLTLSEEELDVLTHLEECKEKGTIKSIVVLLNTALALRADFIDDEKYGIDACMWIGNVGCAGVNAVADVLVGNIVPSGRLSDTYVNDNFSSPAMASWMLNQNGVFNQEYTNSEELELNSTQMYYGIYQEGIYVGYRYYETRYEDTILKADGVGNYIYDDEVAYPFGYGLSYTTFQYSDMSVTENKNGDYDVSITVTNTGNTYSGKEVVQVYLQKPYTEYDQVNGVEKASVELGGFAKTGLLAPGESEKVTVTVERSSFKSYDAEGCGTYILDAGNYYLAVGTDSHNALNNILALKGYGESDGMDADGQKEMAAIALEQAELDDTTYAVSAETGEAITNQLDFADINKYSGNEDAQVTYVSRSDWEGTWPAEAVQLTAGAELLADLGSNKEIVEDESMTAPKYSEGSGLMVAMLRGEEYSSEKWEQLLDQMTFSEQALLVSDGSFSTHSIGSVGIGSTYEQDGPTGVVGSATGISFPSEGIWASSFNTELAGRIGDALGEDARLNNIQGLYLPGINIHRSPYGGRTNEYFSEDPLLTGLMCESEITGVQENGVIAHVKHFIFNDEEAQRNGICIWLNEQAAREIYLRPWEYAVNPSRGNAHAVMSSFNRAGALWTSASENLVQSILRGEFGFDGYVITDMASSNAALFMTYVDGFMNGTDLYLGSGSESALNEYKASATFANRIRESVHRILYVLSNYSAVMNGISTSQQFVNITPWWQTVIYALIGVSGAGTVGFGALVVLCIMKKRKREAKV